MKKIKKSLVLLILVLVANSVLAQENDTHTLRYNENTGSPAATLDVMEFIIGHWRGEAFGGITEEIWSPPLGGSMMCAFKLVSENKVQFYEICTITEEDNSLILRLKHFNGDLKGWEEKDETIDFRLVKVENGKVFFDQFTFEKINEKEINMYVVIQNGAEEKEVKFNYKKF